MTRKIVLYGPPLAGKSTIVSTVAKAQPKNTLRHFLLSDDRRVEHHCVASSFSLHGVTYECFTLAGGVWGHEPWLKLLDGVDGILLVLDLQMVRLATNVAAIERFSAVIEPGFPGCVVFTKNDLAQPDPMLEACHDTLNTCGFGQWPRLVARIDEIRSLLRPVVAVALRIT